MCRIPFFSSLPQHKNLKFACVNHGGKILSLGENGVSMSLNTKPDVFCLSKITLAVTLTLAAGTIVAAEAPVDIEQIVIEGQAHSSGGHLQSISEADLKKLSAATSDTASVLAMLAGVSVNQTGAVSSLPMIRGLSNDRLRVKVD